MRITETSDVWWKTAVIYCLDVETYLDWNDDGRGDFPGLAQRLDYLSSLGVTCLWLMPFYPSPDRDDGYDIVDFYGVDPRLGSSGDLVEVIRTARDRGMRVIADLVVNHTSDKHPWFQAARKDPNSQYRDFYVWRDQPPPKKDQAAVTFPDQETSVWTFDEKAGQYYLHRFYKHQPDLNVANPLVRDEIAKIMGFWVQLGLSGFRVDAVPFFLETLGVPDGDEALPDPHEYLRDLRSMLNRRVGDAILLGEVNLQHPDQLQFFGGPDGDELHMQFDFIGMQRLYLSLARQRLRSPGRGAGDPSAAAAGEPVGQLRPQPRRADPGQAQRGRAAGGVRRLRAGAGDADLRPRPDPPAAADARRRHPPDPDGLQPALRPARHPGAVLRRGDRDGREPRRRRPAGGADPDAVVGRDQRRLLQRPGPQAARAAARGGVRAEVRQRHRPAARPGLAAELHPDAGTTYRNCPELGWGTFEVLEQPHAAVLAHRTTWGDASVVALHNVAAEPVTVPLTLDGLEPGTTLVDLLAAGSTEPDEKGRVELDLEAYGYRWLRVTPPGSRRLR